MLVLFLAFLISIFSVVKEEIIDDDAHLPCFNGRVVSWVSIRRGCAQFCYVGAVVTGVIIILFMNCEVKEMY
jgi:hypothetical protein